MPKGRPKKGHEKNRNLDSLRPKEEFNEFEEVEEETEENLDDELCFDDTSYRDLEAFNNYDDA